MEWGSTESNAICFCVGALIGLIMVIIKHILYKNGLQKREGIGAESVIGIILGLIMAFKGDD